MPGLARRFALQVPDRRHAGGVFSDCAVFAKQKAQRSALCVPREGLEPSRSCEHWILSPTRLPIPPPRHTSIVEDDISRVNRVLV